MDPTHNGRQTLPGSASQPGLFDDIGRNPEARSEVQPGVSAEPKSPLQAGPLAFDEPKPRPQGGPMLVPAPEQDHEPIWVRRLKLVIFVLFCVELGMLLAVLPWTRVWTENSLLAAYPDLRNFLQYDFVRGAITGLGLVDIWLGIREAVNYREER